MHRTFMGSYYRFFVAIRLLETKTHCTFILLAFTSEYIFCILQVVNEWKWSETILGEV